MKKPIVLFLNLVSLLFYNIPACCASIRYAVCEDSNTFQIVHGDHEQKSSCKWLQTQQAQIRDELCKDIEVRTHCSNSCGACCWDDKIFRFQTESDKSRSCYWLSKSSKRILKYCSADEHIRQSCRKSCDFCGAAGISTNFAYLSSQEHQGRTSDDEAEMESSSIPKSSIPVKKNMANDLRQSPNEIQSSGYQDEEGRQGSGLSAMFISMIIFSLIFGVFFSKRIGENVVTFKNVVISKEETEKVSVILKTLWEAKMKPQYSS